MKWADINGESDMSDEVVNVGEESRAAEMTKDIESPGQDVESVKKEVEFAEVAVGYLRARKNLGVALVLTIINMALSAFGSSLNFPFSVFVPDLLVGLGKASNTHGVYCYGASAVVMALFGMCWLFCVVRPWWMVCALVLFVLDTVAMGGLTILCMNGNVDLGMSVLINAVFHIWVLYYLVKGVGAGFKLRRLLGERMALEAQTVKSEAKDRAAPDGKAENADLFGSVTLGDNNG